MKKIAAGVITMMLTVIMAGTALAGPAGNTYQGPGDGAAASKGPAGSSITGFLPPLTYWDEETGEERGAYTEGWIYTPSGWWYLYSDGSWPINRWQMINGFWYRFNEEGHMVTGWYTDKDSNIYYLNPVDDGTLGTLRTGWQVVDNKLYYFNPRSNGYRGALLRNTTTPDGYVVDGNGVCTLPQEH